jgi:hypothetical protein
MDCFSHGQDAHATVQWNLFVDLHLSEMRRSFFASQGATKHSQSLGD